MQHAIREERERERADYLRCPPQRGPGAQPNPSEEFLVDFRTELRDAFAAGAPAANAAAEGGGEAQQEAAWSARRLRLLQRLGATSAAQCNGFYVSGHVAAKQSDVLDEELDGSPNPCWGGTILKVARVLATPGALFELPNTEALLMVGRPVNTAVEKTALRLLIGKLAQSCAALTEATTLPVPPHTPLRAPFCATDNHGDHRESIARGTGTIDRARPCLCLITFSSYCVELHGGLHACGNVYIVRYFPHGEASVWRTSRPAGWLIGWLCAVAGGPRAARRGALGADGGGGDLPRGAEGPRQQAADELRAPPPAGDAAAGMRGHYRSVEPMAVGRSVRKAP